MIVSYATLLKDVEDMLMRSDMTFCQRMWKICLYEVILNFVEAMLVLSEICYMLHDQIKMKQYYRKGFIILFNPDL